MKNAPMVTCIVRTASSKRRKKETYLSTDVKELGDETSDGTVLLAERLESLNVFTVDIGKSSGLGLECLLGDFGELGGNKGNDDNNTHE
jgi:hypothetical protein